MSYREPDFLPWDGQRVPLTFVGGYLGSGKTTAINEVLATAQRPIAVIVNDAGAINIDAKLIKGSDGGVIELTDGCVCCTSLDDMGAALDTIRARPTPPDHLVVELSGLADPQNLLPWGRSAGFFLDGVVIVVAADVLLEEGPPALRLHIEAQIRGADLLVLTKTDLLDDDAAAQARAALRDLAPDTPIVDGSAGRRGPDALGRFIAIGGHHRETGGVPGPTLFDLHETHVVPIPGPLTTAALEALIAELPDRFPGRRVARAKGVVEIVDGEPPGAVLAQLVGSRLAITPLIASEPQTPTDLVVITVDEI